MNMLEDTTIHVKKLRELLEAPLDVKRLVMQHYQEVVRLLAREFMEQEVEELAGRRYHRDKPHDGRYVRWGSNPGSIQVGAEKLPIEVPRVRDRIESEEVPLSSYQSMHEGVAGSGEDQLGDAILLGISQRDYQRVASQFADGFGLSQSSVSRSFVAASTRALEIFESRSLADEDIVALWVDGKTLASEQIVICMGVRIDGKKRILGFIEASSENATAIKGLFTGLIERGLRFSQGLLVILDGAKGMAKAVKETFGHYALIQRCQWHKRENVLSYLKKTDQKQYKARIRTAQEKSSYQAARKALMELHAELEPINRNAARSLLEGMEETLTLHRLGLFDELGRQFKTTNCIENVNSHIERYLNKKVKHWIHSNMRQRWVAMALLEIEPRLANLYNVSYLPLLRIALKREIGIEEESLS